MTVDIILPQKLALSEGNRPCRSTTYEVDQRADPLGTGRLRESDVDFVWVSPELAGGPGFEPRLTESESYFNCQT